MPVRYLTAAECAKALGVEVALFRIAARESHTLRAAHVEVGPRASRWIEKGFDTFAETESRKPEFWQRVRALRKRGRKPKAMPSAPPLAESA